MASTRNKTTETAKTINWEEYSTIDQLPEIYDIKTGILAWVCFISLIVFATGVSVYKVYLAILLMGSESFMESKFDIALIPLGFVIAVIFFVKMKKFTNYPNPVIKIDGKGITYYNKFIPFEKDFEFIRESENSLLIRSQNKELASLRTNDLKIPEKKVIHLILMYFKKFQQQIGN